MFNHATGGLPTWAADTNPWCISSSYYCSFYSKPRLLTNYDGHWEASSTTWMGTIGIESHHSFSLLLPCAFPKCFPSFDVMMMLCNVMAMSMYFKGTTAKIIANTVIAAITISACCKQRQELFIDAKDIEPRMWIKVMELDRTDLARNISMTCKSVQ